MNIALLSDTHGHIDDRIKRHVDGCDEVWHAGDIGDLHVTDALADITKVRAVYGNIDDQLARRTWPEHQYFLRFQAVGWALEGIGRLKGTVEGPTGGQ